MNQSINTVWTQPVPEESAKLEEELPPGPGPLALFGMSYSLDGHELALFFYCLGFYCLFCCYLFLIDFPENFGHIM